VISQKLSSPRPLWGTSPAGRTTAAAVQPTEAWLCGSDAWKVAPYNVPVFGSLRILLWVLILLTWPLLALGSRLYQLLHPALLRPNVPHPWDVTTWIRRHRWGHQNVTTCDHGIQSRETVRCSRRRACPTIIGIQRCEPFTGLCSRPIFRIPPPQFRCHLSLYIRCRVGLCGGRIASQHRLPG